MHISRLRALGGAADLGAQRAQNLITIFAVPLFRTLGIAYGYTDYAVRGIGRIGHRLVSPIGQAVVGAVRDFFRGDIEQAARALPVAAPPPLEQAPIDPLQGTPLPGEQAPIDPPQVDTLPLEQACLDPDSFAKASAILDQMSEADRAKCRPLLARLMAKCSGNVEYQMVLLQEIEVNPPEEQVEMIGALRHLLDTNLPTLELYNSLVLMRSIEVDQLDSLFRNARILMSPPFNEVVLLIVELNQQNKPSDAVVQQLKQLCELYKDKNQNYELINKICSIPSNDMRKAILDLINTLDFSRICFKTIRSIIDQLSECELDEIRSWESIAALNGLPLEDQPGYAGLLLRLFTKILNNDRRKFFLKTALLPLPECLRAIEIEAPRAFALAQLCSSSLDALICALLACKSNIEDDQIQSSFEFFSHVSTPFDPLTVAFYFERGLKQVPRGMTVEFAQDCSKLARRLSHPSEPLPSHLLIAMHTLLNLSPQQIESFIEGIISIQKESSRDLHNLISGMIVEMIREGKNSIRVFTELRTLLRADAPIDRSLYESIRKLVYPPKS